VLPCIVLLLGAASHAYAQDSSGVETLRVQVRLVNLFVDVTDEHGVPVPNLQKNNFNLFEDGRLQTISIFEPQTGVPLSIVLAMDTSGSTHKDSSLEQRAAHDFAQSVLTPKDQLALFSFNSDVREVVPFTNNLHRIDSGMNNLGRGPATAFYAAVLLASQSLATNPGRKVLLVVSDGSNTVSGTSFDEALAAAQRSDVIIYSLIDVPIEADAGRDTAGEHAMITLSQETGGQAFYVDQGGLDAAFRKVSDDLRTQYLLGYYPLAAPAKRDPLTGPQDFRSIKVTLQGLAAGAQDTPHYRNGYYRAATQP
jgi:Ca-activated chloride channel family protein